MPCLKILSRFCCYMQQNFAIKPFCPTHNVLCIYLRTNSDLCHLQHKLIRFYNRDLSLYCPVVTICTTSIIFKNCTLCPHCIYVFCIYLRTNSDLCHLQHKLIGFLYQRFNPLHPSGHYMYHQYNIQQLYALPTLY